MPVRGMGVDIVQVSRIAESLERFGERMRRRLFTDAEREYCERHKDPLPHYAARFAAKEAVSKAFTTGIGAELGWKSVSVYHGARHEPLVRLDEKGTALLAQVGATQVLLTLSHTESHAMAVAVLLDNRKRG